MRVHQSSGEVTTTANNDNFPVEFRADIDMVVGILQVYRARQIILYGSVARGDAYHGSDLDFCVEGLAAKDFFIALAECLLNTEHSISIVDRDALHGYFLERVLQEGIVVYEQK